MWELVATLRIRVWPGADLEVWILHHLYLAGVAIGIVRGDGAQFAGVWKLTAAIDDALARACVEAEPVCLAMYQGPEVYLFILESMGMVSDEISVGDGELHVVTVRLGMTGQSHRASDIRNLMMCTRAM